jgi:hypothetical protein
MASETTYLWPTIEDLNDLEREIISQKRVPQFRRKEGQNILEWIQDGTGTTLRVNSEAVQFERVPCSGPAASAISKRCRQLNNILQTEQIIWMKMKAIAQSIKELSATRERLHEEFSAKCEDLLFSNSDFTNSETERDVIQLMKTMFSKDNFHRKNELLRDFVKQKTNDLEDELKVKEDELFAHLQTVANKVDDSSGLVFTPGPAGDLPIHDCFLLDLKSIGKRMVEEFFCTPELLSLPYSNDLDPWRKICKTAENSPWEDGLYTGETVLHIAIVKEDVELVEYFAHRGIHLSSRARGTFFQRKWIRPRVHSLTFWQWLKAKLGGIDLKIETFAAVELQLNQDSG